MFLGILLAHRADDQLLLGLLDLIINPGIVVLGQPGEHFERLLILLIVFFHVVHLQPQVPLLLVTAIIIRYRLESILCSNWFFRKFMLIE
jgi:hypothetical protein